MLRCSLKSLFPPQCFWIAFPPSSPNTARSFKSQLKSSRVLQTRIPSIIYKEILQLQSYKLLPSEKLNRIHWPNRQLMICGESLWSRKLKPKKRSLSCMDVLNTPKPSKKGLEGAVSKKFSISIVRIQLFRHRIS